MKVTLLVFAGIVIVSTIVLGGGILLFLENSNSTIHIPPNHPKIETFLKQGCTEEAISFLTSNETPLHSDFSDVEKCLEIIQNNRK